MKTSLLLTALILCSFFSRAQSGATTLKFPADFNLPDKEIPKGYALIPINAEARKAGITANPGMISAAGFIEGLYEHADPATIEKVYVGIYRPQKKQHSEMGYYAIAYKSVEALQEEQRKIRKYPGAHYFIKDRYLLQVWGDAGSFQEAVDHVAVYFQHRLQLEEFMPPEDTDNVTEVTDMSEQNTTDSVKIDIAVPAKE